MSVSRAANVANPSASYDSWPSLPSTQLEGSDRCCCACCPRRRLSWTAVSVVEIALMVMTVVAYFFFPKDSLQRFLARDTDKGGQITELSEWMLRMVASMISVQITLLVAGIGWGDAISRKIIYWGMLTGDVLLVAIHASLVHSLSEWHAVNIAVVTLASGFGLFRIITLILNPNWWAWVQVEAGY